MITLGIDIGTTHTKVLALEVDTGATVAIETAPTPVHRSAAGEAHRPAEVLTLVIELAASVVDALPAGAHVGALCVASVGEEVVLVDRGGASVGDAIAWYDPRGFDQARAFLAGPGADLFLSRRWPPDRTFSLFKLCWLREHEPDRLAAATTWTDLGDFVLHGLGGELVMDHSHASRSGTFDLVARAWDDETIAAAGLDLGFPQLVPSGSVIGQLMPPVAEHIGLEAGVALVSGGHDHLVAAYGAGLHSPTQLFLSAGTSEAHVALLAAPLEGERANGIDQGCFVDDGSWYAHVNVHAGRFFEQWRALLYADTTDASMYHELGSAGGGDVRFEPAADQRLGDLRGVAYDAGRADIMRAVLAGLAARSATIVEQPEDAAGSRFERIVAAGHPTRIPLWRRLRQASYRWPLATVDEPEPTAWGAAVLAARAVDRQGGDQLLARRARSSAPAA